MSSDKYSIEIKIAGSLSDSFKSALQGAQAALDGLAEAAGASGSAVKAAAKDIGAGGSAVKAAARDIKAGNAAMERISKDADEGADSVSDLGDSADGAKKKFSRFNSVLKGVKSGISGFAKAAGKIGKATMKATAAGIGTATTAAVGLGTAAVNVGKEFETAMSQVSATMLLDQGTEEGKAAFQTLEDAARECGASTAFSATEAAEGLNYLALAGYDAEKAAAALPTVLKLAGAGAMELGDASDMVTDAMSALDIEATQDNLKAFADNLAMTASKSNTSVAQLGEAILTVGGTAQGLKGGTTELSAMAGILADSGIKASEGGTHIRNMIMSLQMPRNDKAAGMFKDLGLEAYDAAGNMRSMGDIFGDLNAQLAGASAADVNTTLSTIFKQTDLAAARAMMAATADSMDSLGVAVDASLAESGTSMAKLGINLNDMAKGFDTAMSQEAFAAQMMEQFGITGEQAGVIYSGLQSVVSGAGNRFEELSGYIADSKDACQDMYDIQLDNLEGDLKILSSAASDLGISFYKDVNGPLRAVTQTASNMVTQLNSAYKSGGLSAMMTEVGDCMAQMVNGVAQYAPMAVNVGIDLVQSLVDGVTQNSSGIASAAGEVLTAFAGGIFQLAPQLAFAGIDIIVQLADSLTAQAPQLLSSGTQAIANFVSGLVQRGPDVANAALGLTQALVTGIVSNAPTLLIASVQLVGSLVSGIGQMLPQVVQMGIQLILGLVQGLVSSLPAILSTGTQAIVGFIDGIIQALPLLLQGGLQLITMLVQGVMQNLPAIGQAAISIIGSLANGLISALPMVFEAVVAIPGIILEAVFTTDWLSIGLELVSSLATGIIDGLKSIGSSVMDTIKGWFGGGDDSTEAAESAASTVSSYADGIQANAGAVTGAASSLSTTAFSGMDFTAATAAGTQSADAFSTGLNGGMMDLCAGTSGISLDNAALAASFGQAGTEGADAFSTGLADGLAGFSVDTSSIGLDSAALAANLGQAGADGAAALGGNLNAGLASASADTSAQMAQITTAVQDNMSQADSAVQQKMAAMVSRIQSGGSQMVQAATSAAQGIKNAFGGIDLSQAGTNMMQGLVNGISSMQSQVEAAAKNVAQAAANSVNRALQIHSPSRLMIKSGQFVDEGLAGGMLKNTRIVKSASQAAMAQPVVETGAGVQNAMSRSFSDVREGIQGGGRVRSALDGIILSSSTVNNNDNGVENSNSEFSPSFVFSPTYNINGSASKDDIEQAGRDGQAEFERRMKAFLRKNGRTKFA